MSPWVALNLTFIFFVNFLTHQRKPRKLQTIIDLYRHSPQLLLNPMISTLSMLSSPKLSGKHFRSALSMRQPPTRNASRSCLIFAPSGSLHTCEFGVNPILEKSVKRTCTVTPIHLPGIANLDSLANSSCISRRSSLSVMRPKDASSTLIRYTIEWPRHQPPWLTAYSLDLQRRQEPQQSWCHSSSVPHLSLPS